MPALTLLLAGGEFAVCRLPPDAPVPAWAGSGVFSSATRTTDERQPAGVKHEADWRLLKFAGPFPFTETGILAAVLAPLGTAKISVLATATFDTDYVFVKATQLAAAIRALEAAGHTVRNG